MRKGAINKTQALRIHARRQALARYGIELSDEELRHLANLIRRGDGGLVERKSLRVSCWRVTFRKLDLVVLYDRTRRTIVTFLPADCWEIRQSAAPCEAPLLPLEGVSL